MTPELLSQYLDVIGKHLLSGLMIILWIFLFLVFLGAFDRD